MLGGRLDRILRRSNLAWSITPLQVLNLGTECTDDYERQWIACARNKFLPSEESPILQLLQSAPMIGEEE